MTNQQHADNFVGRYNGKPLDEDKEFGQQCWDVVARYAKEEFGCPSFPTVSGGAEGLWRFFAEPIPQYFDKVSRDYLEPGDVAVWDASFYPPYGHTALVWQRDGGNVFVLEQDGSHPTGVSYIAHRVITNKLAGGLRPKNKQGEPMIEAGDVKNLIPEFVPRQANDGDVAFGTQKNGKDYAYALASWPERKAYVKDLENWKGVGVTASQIVNSGDSDAAKLTKLKQLFK